MIGWALTTVTAVGWGVGSLVVERLRVPLLVGLVTPSSVTVTVVLAAIVLSLLSQHSRLGSVRREQKPTVLPATTTVPPVQLARLLVAGRVMLMRLLAASASAPEAEVVNAIVDRAGAGGVARGPRW